jgi:hypothetical protein
MSDEINIGTMVCAEVSIGSPKQRTIIDMIVSKVENEYEIEWYDKGYWTDYYDEPDINRWSKRYDELAKKLRRATNR